MKTTAIEIKQHLPFLEPNLIQEMVDSGVLQEIPKDTIILEEGVYVKMVPIILEGLLKVFTGHEDKNLLLYYIQPNESCVMSFAAGLNNEKSKVNAITIEDSKLLLLPADKVQKWVKQYPHFNRIFYNQYNLRFEDLITTIQHLIFDKLDVRLYDYLKEKAKILDSKHISLTHQTIANELGTAREVISRLLKKLEKEQKIILHTKEITIL